MDESWDESAEYRDEKILSKILNLLGFESIDMGSFDNRLKYQKLIYLVQNSGLSLGYGYNWYVRGPYSPSLTQDLFEINRNNQIFESGKRLALQNEQEIAKRIETIKTLLGKNIENSVFLEVLASLIYLKKSSAKSDCASLKKRLLTLKPRLNQTSGIEEMLNEACKMLRSFGA
jgi:uncharacterized protein YwgA